MFNEFIINKNNLTNNIKQVKSQNQNSLVCAMVKANAYGVGVKPTVQTIDEYVDFYGVACFFEAKKLRELTNKKILIVGPLEKENINTDFSFTCNSIEDVIFLSKLNLPINIHLKVNTGMNRYGIKTMQEFEECLKLANTSQLILEGVFTHFATTDDFVNEQFKLFNKFIKKTHQFGFDPIVHADNSEVNQTKNHNLDMVRVGYNLFNNNSQGFCPVVEIKSKVTQINVVKAGEQVGYSKRFVAKNKMRVAVVPVGYADGFLLRFVGFDLMVNGVKCKVLNVCMDCFMLDVTNTTIKKGDEVFVLNNFNSLKRYAEFCNTIDYEIMCGFNNIRAKRKTI